MIARALMALCLLLPAGPAFAEIVIAQVSTKSGPLAVTATGAYEGAKACFDLVNAQGGINGQRIRFVLEDDQYKQEETVRLMGLVAQRDRPLAFLNMTGSPNVLALQSGRTLEDLRVPVIGVIPGAESLRKPGSPWMFHIHAGDRAQIRQILKHVSTLGITKIAVAYQDNPFGTSGLGYLVEAAADYKLTVTGNVALPVSLEKLDEAAAALRRSNAQTYVMVLGRYSFAALVRDLRAAGDKVPAYGMSYVPVEAVLEKTPLDLAVGVALAQVLPNATAQRTAFTREFHQAMARHAAPGVVPGNAHLTGYLAARIAVEAIRRSGASPTPEKMAAALRTLRLDLGGYAVDFGAGKGVATQWVDIGVLDRTGRLMY
jgi:ABC-type branched-subunit amino acid transport system substrate-binding protein